MAKINLLPWRQELRKEQQRQFLTIMLLVVVLVGLGILATHLQYARKIGIQESRVDKLEWDLTKEIFNSELDFAHQSHLKLCLDSIVEVSDRAEDAGDQLELATLKSMV